MQRKGIIFTAVCVGLLLLIVAVSGAYRYRGRPAGPVDRVSLENLRKQLHQKVQGWVLDQNYARPGDEGVKTVDLGQLMIYFAKENDRDSYTRVRDYVLEHMTPHLPDVPYADGFIYWVYHPDRGAELQDTCTGTTEMLRVAKGMWIASEQFKDPEDRERAVRIVRAYLRHQEVESGHWYIANYIKVRFTARETAWNALTATRPNLQAKDVDASRLPPRGEPIFQKATNSFLIDYDADFLNEVAQKTGDAEIRDAAEKSYALVHEAARTTSGLIMDMVQPEVATLLPESLWVYAPNDVIGVGNSATIAELAYDHEPKVATQLLAFTRARPVDALDSYYKGSGERWSEAGIKDPGYYTFCPLARLACRVNDRNAAREYVRRAAGYTQGFVKNPTEPRINIASEMLLTLQAALKQSDLE